MYVASISGSMHLTGKRFGQKMDVAFRSAALAALCNSELRLAERWGPEVGRTVARRLLDLAAIDAAALDRLPGASVSVNGTGEATVTFGRAIVIRGVMGSSKNGTGSARTDTDHIVITSLDVHGSRQL